MQTNNAGAFVQTDADRALVEVIKILARRGRAIRQAREQEAKSAGNLGRDAADLANDNGTRRKECTDAKK
jgi:hypothetical protein